MLVCHQYEVCTHSVGSVYVGGYGGLSESGLCVFRELCQVSFLVVGESSSVLLSSVVMSSVIVVIMGKWSDEVRVELSTMSGCTVY